MYSKATWHCALVAVFVKQVYLIIVDASAVLYVGAFAVVRQVRILLGEQL